MIVWPRALLSPQTPPTAGASPDANRELHGIQMLRAVAALAVVAHHILDESKGAAGHFSPDWLTTVGAGGVDLFFVISGSIMLYVSYPLNRAPLSPGRFLVRRALRIYPLYWLCCLGMLSAHTVGFMANHGWTAADLIASFTLVPTDNPIIGVSWTLVYELYFYVIFAGFLALRSRGTAVLGSTTVIIGAGWLGGLLPSGVLRAFLTNPVPLEFCMGLGLGWAFTALRGRARFWPTGWGPAALGCLLFAIAAATIPDPHDTAGLTGFPRVLGWGLPAVVMVAAALRAGPPRRWLGRSFTLLGNASYAMYLSHTFIVLIYARLIKTTVLGAYDQIYVVPLAILLSIVTAIFVHLAIEQPMLQLARKMMPQGRRMPAVVH